MAKLEMEPREEICWQVILSFSPAAPLFNCWVCWTWLRATMVAAKITKEERMIKVFLGVRRLLLDIQYLLLARI